MNILALDTSIGVCGAAVLLAGGDAQRTLLCEESMARGHAEALMPMVAEAMVGAGIGFAEIDVIAVADQVIRQPARLGALPAVRTPAAERFAGQALAGIGDAKRAVDEDFQRHGRWKLRAES